MFQKYFADVNTSLSLFACQLENLHSALWLGGQLFHQQRSCVFIEHLEFEFFIQTSEVRGVYSRTFCASLVFELVIPDKIRSAGKMLGRRARKKCSCGRLLRPSVCFEVMRCEIALFGSVVCLPLL